MVGKLLKYLAQISGLHFEKPMCPAFYALLHWSYVREFITIIIIDETTYYRHYHNYILKFL